MYPALLGDPLLAWRDDTTLQIGWGSHCIVVEQAPAGLPAWLRTLRGEASEEQVLATAAAHGLSVEEAGRLLLDLRDAGLLCAGQRLRVAIAARGLVVEELGSALRAAGVEVLRVADVVVFPQGHVPSLVNAPQARRLVPLWFGARAVHVGPVIDDTIGPCPCCIDLAWSDADPLWAQLVAQSGTVCGWSHPAQLVQAAGVIALLGTSPAAVGLEMILDPAAPGPRWRVWSSHPRCACQK